jgi:cytochrome c biogenesis protein CcdA
MTTREKSVPYQVDKLINSIYLNAILAMVFCGYPILFIAQHWKLVSGAITVYAAVGIIIFALLFAIGFVHLIIDLAIKIRKLEAKENAL